MQDLQYVGSVSSEGGPIVGLDAATLPDWTGAGGGRCDDLCDWLDNHPESVGTSIEVGAGVGFGWDIGGAGTADVYRIRDDEVILYRYWPDRHEVGRRDLRLPETPGEALGRLIVTSGLVVMFWSVVSGSDIGLPVDLSDGVALEAAGIGGAGTVIHLPPGEYRVWGTHDSYERWCRVSPRQVG